MMTSVVTLAAALIAADGPPPARTTYYLGESRVALADDRPLGHMVMLVRREMVPAESKIVETVVNLSSRPGEPVKELVAVLAVKGNRFTVKERSGGFAGEGELVGKPWEWTALNTTSKLTGETPGTVKSFERAEGRGLVVTKGFYGPDGKLRVKFTEDYATIDPTTFMTLRSKLLPRPAAAGPARPAR